jgi:hypothetical protein
MTPRYLRPDTMTVLGTWERLAIAYECCACRSLAAYAASSGDTDGVVDIGISTLD